MVIAILGTDGSGKTTVINAIQSMNNNCVTYHLRPKLFRNISDIGKKKSEISTVVIDPHGKKPHNTVVSVLLFFYYYIDYILGFWLKVSPKILQGKLVVFDRYYYDYYIDSYRFRSSLSENWFRFWEFLIPKPNHVFLLDGTAELFYSRKQEVSHDELSKQILKMRRLAETRRWFTIVNASKTPDEIASTILLHISDEKKIS